MALDNNQFDGHGDIAQFLEKFKEQSFPGVNVSESHYTPRESSVPAKPAQYERSFEKLEKKILELEERFEASAAQNQMILSELARTREAMERQKDKDAFLEHLSRTIANLKASVENLSRAQQDRMAYREPAIQRSFDPVPPAFKAGDTDHTAIYHYQADGHTAGRTNTEREEKERIISSLRQKASQLKAVNSALDREIKKAQQEKLEALKKSAEQAKEILSLRDQLTAAEERFKSFDFEGRIISIKQEYQQKVSSLENQLQQISDTCMKQVEEIESLKAENLKLHKAAAEKEEALSRLEAKERELLTLKAEMASLQENNSKRAQKQLAVFSERLRTLEDQRDGLAAQLEQAQASLDAVRQEKELLEKNFKELLEKINNNDAVIEQLKHKIEVLGQQNEELTHHNEALSQQNASLQNANETLSREKEQMYMRAEELAQEKEGLASQAAQWGAQNEALSAERENLARQNEALTAQAEQLAREKEELSGRAEFLSREKSELSAERENLTRQNEELAARAGHLEQEKAALEARTENLTREKEGLASQAAELNAQKQALSAQTENLTREKESLRSQTESLSREKEGLASRVAYLAKEKDSLDIRARQLDSEKEALSQNIHDLNQQKAALEREKAELSLAGQELKKRTEKLETETKELAKENQQLRNQSAALLAARLVQEKERATKEEVLRKAAPKPPQKPAMAAEETAASPAASVVPAVKESLEQEPLPKQPLADPAVAPADAKPQNDSRVPLSEKPVEIKETAQPKVMTEADLPEIKVADPVPQPQPLFDGEDFLEKTDSFIGRMKWSIFREDR